MSSQGTAQATAVSPTTTDRHGVFPQHDLSLKETLRVMDVAREMRDSRQQAEEMFRRDDLRTRLREKLLRTARMSGDSVSEAEIDAAIGQYLDRQHTFRPAPPGAAKVVAHLWVWRGRIAVAAAMAASVAAGFWFLLG